MYVFLFIMNNILNYLGITARIISQFFNQFSTAFSSAQSLIPAITKSIKEQTLRNSGQTLLRFWLVNFPFHFTKISMCSFRRCVESLFESKCVETIILNCRVFDTSSSTSMTFKITKDTPDDDHFNLHVQVHPVSVEYCLRSITFATAPITRISKRIAEFFHIQC